MKYNCFIYYGLKRLGAVVDKLKSDKALAPVQRAVLDRFRDVIHFDVRFAFKIGEDRFPVSKFWAFGENAFLT